MTDDQQGARLARYAEAMAKDWNEQVQAISEGGELSLALTPVNTVAVADQETAELRAEVERLTELHHDVSEAVKPYEPNPGTVTVAQRIGILGRGRKVSDEQHEHFAREAKRARDARDWWRESALGEKARAEAAEAESVRLASERRELAAQVAGLRSVVAKVEAFIVKRIEYVTTLRQCVEADADADYHRWQGHAEARRQLADALGVKVPYEPSDAAEVRAALASVGVSGSADDRREANASQAPDTATPGEVCSTCGQSMDSPPCSRSADGSMSGHTIGGGANKCEATR